MVRYYVSFTSLKERRALPLKECSCTRRRVITSALTVMIADPDEDLLNILKEQLVENYALLHATNREEAIASLERLRSKIELAIIDSPDFSGWDLIGRLTIRDSQRIKIVAATSIDSNKVVETTNECGVDAVVRNPISDDESHNTRNSHGWKVKLLVEVEKSCVVQIKTIHFP